MGKLFRIDNCLDNIHYPENEKFFICMDAQM